MGSVLAGEDSLIGRCQEAKEELRIILNPAQDGGFLKHAVKSQDLYVCGHSMKILIFRISYFQETEVIDVKWVKKHGLIKYGPNRELHPLLDIGNVVNEVI